MVVVILFTPGYIFLQFTKNAVAFIPQGVDARYFFAVISWGSLIHLAFFWWTRSVLDWYLAQSLNRHELEVALWAFTVLVAAPLLTGLAGSWLIQLGPINGALARVGMDYVSRTPSAWNYATKLGPRWVRVHLTDGTIIGGTYGPAAFADDTGEKDIFLDQVYNIDDTGDFADVVTRTAGVWIKHDEISHVMFFHPGRKESTTDGQKTDRDAQTATPS